MDSALMNIARTLVAPGKGILAVDSTKGIIKRFAAVGLVFTPELDQKYKRMLISTPGLEQFISGVILNDRNIRQDVLTNKEIVLGIKVDEGLEPFGDGKEETTKGLEGLEKRLKEYVGMGAGFTKWRGVIKISDIFPTEAFLNENLNKMVEFAHISQLNVLVPVVEPEVFLEGNHTIARCEEVETKTLKLLFEKLQQMKVDLTGLVLKTSMVLPGKNSGVRATPLEVAQATVRTLNNSVPPEVSGVVFLSGGQTADEATANLNEIEKNVKDCPWPISFSFERALQQEVLVEWAGKDENVKKAQEVFYKRVKLVSLAREGKL